MLSIMMASLCDRVSGERSILRAARKTACDLSSLIWTLRNVHREDIAGFHTLLDKATARSLLNRSKGRKEVRLQQLKHGRSRMGRTGQTVEGHPLCTVASSTSRRNVLMLVEVWYKNPAPTGTASDAYTVGKKSRRRLVYEAVVPARIPWIPQEAVVLLWTGEASEQMRSYRKGRRGAGVGGGKSRTRCVAALEPRTETRDAS